MKLTWLDGVSILLLTSALASGVWHHYPLEAPWALAFAAYVSIRVGRDVFLSWRSEKQHQRIYNATEVAELSRHIQRLEALVLEVKAERAAMASLEADVRAMQSQANTAQVFGGYGIGPSFGPTRGG